MFVKVLIALLALVLACSVSVAGSLLFFTFVSTGVAYFVFSIGFGLLCGWPAGKVMGRVLWNE